MAPTTASDPGFAFMSEVVQQLNSWLSMEHQVSSTGRHESNGCEEMIKHLLRHLCTLVLDGRLCDKRSDDTVLPLINLHLVSYPTDETGKYTPLQHKPGTLDAKRSSLPEMLSLATGAKAASIFRELDENLRHIRDVSSKLQTTLAEERAARDLNISSTSRAIWFSSTRANKPRTTFQSAVPTGLAPIESSNKSRMMCP